ncbi:putative polysaccharide biosynthesis protein [Anaeromicropila populeti]|uniref:Stage V sporulation protein B n=1 Tax=Anaeromicropila populeti TaxID=37658 RepID=A0A1I6KW47_9FIRM|nr:polysaccharide biosynthesis protein [Anaeromicropila populeti]SFR95441.1 stage V sporulation protein B [Anaeromicropila populeti]
MKKSTILKGTMILTLAGLATRIIGFFYRIYLSNALGAEKLGIYQLVFPVYGICFTIYASGIQTAISKLVADQAGRQHYLTTQEQKESFHIKKILLCGLFCSITTALCLSVLLYHNASFIATHIIKEPACTNSLKVLSYVFPFCGGTACINGYYYGLKKSGVPAVTQLLEQFVRVISVYVIATYFGKGDAGVTCELAVFGVVIGEIVSNLYNICSLAFVKIPAPADISHASLPVSKILFPLLKYSVPLTGNHLIVSLLHSLEAILIPTMLKRSGLSTSEALSVYGVLTGMALPFILFPSAITNSLAVLLLPTISEANAAKNQSAINQTTSISIKYSLVIGIFSTGIFIFFGRSFGDIFFHNQQAGSFLVTLSWLCPFIYLTTTLGSIINGLGKTHLTFINTICGLSIRILFVFYMVPNKGIYGYLIGLLVSQLAIALLDYLSLVHTISIKFDAVNSLLKPALIIFILGMLSQKTYHFFQSGLHLGNAWILLIVCSLVLTFYLLLLFITHSLSAKDFK